MAIGTNRVEILITAKDMASKQLNQVGKAAGGVGGKLKGLAKGPLPAVASAAALAGATASVKLAAGFEKGMAEVRTLLPNITDEAFSKMEKDALNFSRTMGVDLQDATKGLYNAISAGVPAENVMTFMAQAGKTATGGVTDLETSVTALAGVMNVYGDAVGGAKEVSDILFTTVKGGMTTMPELAASIGRVLPTAAAMGVTFKDVSADLAVMTAQTGDTPGSVTRLNALFVEAGRTGTKLADAIKSNLGSSFRELIAEGKSTGEIFQSLRETMPEQEFTDLFGSVEAMNGALQITGENSGKVSEQLDKMTESAGATDQAFKTMQETSSKKMSDAMNSIKVSMAEIGAKILPHVAKAMAALAQGISKGIELMPKLIKKIEPLKPVLQVVFGVAKTGFEIWLSVIKLVFKGIESLISLIKKIAPNLAGPFELIKKGLRMYLDIIEKIEAIGNKLTGGLFGKIFSKVIGVTPGVVAARALLGDDQVWEEERRTMKTAMLGTQEVGPGLAGLGAGAGLSKLNFLTRDKKVIDAGSLIPRMSEFENWQHAQKGKGGIVDAVADMLPEGWLADSDAVKNQEKAKLDELKKLNKVGELTKDELEELARQQAEEAERQLQVSKLQISLMGKNLDEIVNSGSLVGMTQSEINTLFQASQMNAQAAEDAIRGFSRFRSDEDLARSFAGDPKMLAMQKELQDKLREAYINSGSMVSITGGNLGMGGRGLAGFEGQVARVGLHEIAPGVYYNVTVEGNIFAADDSGQALVEVINKYAVGQGKEPPIDA